MLPNGNVFLAPVSQFGGCLIYNVTSNNWQVAASTGNMDETCWVKLSNDNILGIETASQIAVHYVPSSNQWITDNSVAVPIYGYGSELGAGILLPNGNAFYIGGSTNTAIYTPGVTPASAGTWVAGPVMVFGTNQLGAVDAPAAMMANGIILCALGPAGGFNGPTSFYEYDYNANAFTQVNAPGGGSTYNASAPFGTSMLALPDGTVLFIGGQNTKSLYVYAPDGAPLAAGQPSINGISGNADGSYHLTGTGLTGISQGAEYGDDEQMNSNYPLVRMTNSVTGNVYYARTFNWSSTGVQTGNHLITTEFSLPQNLPAGTYSVVVVANGNPSVPTNFTYSPPPVPTGLTAASGSNAYVILNWNSSAGATAYNVKSSSSIGGYFSTIATINGLSFTNTGLTNGLTCYYKVSAISPNGPSSDSAAASATPAGPPQIPGATPISLASFYNRTGIFTDGQSFSTGVDGGSAAYSANLLGPAFFWNNLVFSFGPANTADVVSCAGQTIPLPAGRFNSVQILATGVQGSQMAQTFTVTYTDASTTTFTQSISDWANPQSYPGEITAIKMPYRNLNSGIPQALNVTLDGYVFTLDQTRTVQSITLPNNSNVVLLSLALADNPVSATLGSYYNRAGIYTDGTTFTNPATGGVDGNGSAYSGTLLGSSQTWSNTLFNFGPINTTNVISCAGQTITLPPGNYSRLLMLGAGVNGSQALQSFVVTYSDSTTTPFTQSMSDWFSPQNYGGESKVVIMSHRNRSDGSVDVRTFYLYGYSFALNTAKTVRSIKLPNNSNDIVTAISLVPNWPPTFAMSPFTLATANAGQPYSGTIATNASDLNGGTLTLAKVSGPAWLNMAANGVLSGTPLSSDVGNNSFTVSVTDTGGLSSTATMNIAVTPAPPIISTMSSQSGSLLLNWTGGIAPYQVQASTDLVNSVWQNFGAPINGNGLSITPSNNATFYRIIGQ
jgi:hypothetical protein